LSILEQLRQELGYADYLGALQRYRVEHVHDPHILEMSSFLVIIHLPTGSFPKHWIGDGSRGKMAGRDLFRWRRVFNPKSRTIGSLESGRCRVLIYIHKEQMLHDVQLRTPQTLRFVDDKIRL